MCFKSLQKKGVLSAVYYYFKLIHILYPLYSFYTDPDIYIFYLPAVPKTSLPQNRECSSE